MKKLLFTIGISILVNIVLYSQYDYGLDIQEKDAKISGKLNLVSGANSVIIGDNSGINIDETTARENTFIGSESGEKTNTGVSNTFVGFKSGENNRAGSWNVFMGTWAGQYNSTLGNGVGNTFIGVSAGQFNRENASSNTFIGESAGISHYSGSSNTFIGRGAGLNHNTGDRNVFLGFQAGALGGSGSDNVFIGFDAGSNHTGDNMLVIENSSSNTPLVYGEFNNDKLQINGSIHITEFMKLVPGAAPSSPEKGTMYYDSSDDNVKVWTGTWENLFFTSSTNTETSFTQRNESPCNTSCVEENQKLKIRVEQLESKLAKYDAMETKMERMEKLLNQLSGSSAINQSIEITKSARLEQNTPNPFRSATNIKYFLPLNSKNSKINIYNISGQNIKTIMLEGNGMGEIEVQIGELSKGIYHYSLEIDGQIIDTKKMSSIE